MAYMALYRKHRSQTFDEILGQEHITTTLKNQIMNDKIAHAYLFCGIRGIGKTSIAKILGKAVNCEHPVNGNPCLACKTCKDIASDTILNVIEIDAASNTGVDDVRNIRDDALYMPATGKYKVYIIDEVHMLSKNAFNALLKILEEPPKHVIFILATTESQKIPATILSRCQRFDLKRISKNLMKDRMKEYLAEENVTLEEKALDYIVELSEGSMRDGLSILEQIISIKEGETITFVDVLNVLGNVDYSTYNDFTIALENKDIKACVEKINEIYDEGKDIVTFASMYCNYLRNLVLIASNTDLAMLDMSEENANRLKEITKEIPLKKLIYLLEEFINVEKTMKMSNMPKLMLEMLVIRLSKEEEVYSPVQMISNCQIQSSSQTAAQTAMQAESILTPQSEATVKAMKPRVLNLIESIEPGNLDSYIDAWNTIVDQTQGLGRAKLNAVKINSLIGNDVYMTAEMQGIVDYILKNKEKLEQHLPKINGKIVNINIVVEENLKQAMTKAEENKPMDDSAIDSLTDILAKSGVNANVK